MGVEALLRNEEVPANGRRSRERNVTQGNKMKGNVTFLKRSKGKERNEMKKKRNVTELNVM